MWQENHPKIDISQPDKCRKNGKVACELTVFERFLITPPKPIPDSLRNITKTLLDYFVAYVRFIYIKIWGEQNSCQRSCNALQHHWFARNQSTDGKSGSQE